MSISRSSHDSFQSAQSHTLPLSPQTPTSGAVAPIDDWSLDESDPPAPLTPLLHPAASLAPRDTLTLRAFDDLQPPSAPANTLIGVFDPAAETDDWAADFDLDDHDDNAVSFAAGNVSTWVPPQNLQVEVHARADHSLPLRLLPPSAFATPVLSYASLLMYPRIGYDIRALHPSLLRVQRLFACHNSRIRSHFDALIRECGGILKLGQNTLDLYLLSVDSQVAGLQSMHVDMASHMLVWRLELATLNADLTAAAGVLLVLSALKRKREMWKDALRLIDDARGCIYRDKQRNTTSVALAVELEYDACTAYRAMGAMAEAGRALKRAVANAEKLVTMNDEGDRGGLRGCEQRGVWWLLRCKFLQAEMAYDLGDHDSAVQFYSEYIVESITRMIGVTLPPGSRETALGEQFMRYCLFSPRRLVVALWTTVISLGEMKSFAAAAEVASFTDFVASAFGYQDANEAALAIRGRIKEIGIELNQQYDVISKSILQRNSQPDRAADNEDESPFDYGVGKFPDVNDDVIEDWDTQLEKELNISIQRCDGDQVMRDDMSFSAPDANVDGPMRDGQLTTLSISSRVERAPSTIHKWQEVPSANVPPRAATDLSSGLSNQRQGALIESELLQYLSRLTGAANALSTQQMYPKPTQPFDGHLLGPREHEEFLRMFVRLKDPVLSRRLRHGLPITPQWHPSAECKLNYDIEPAGDIDLFNSNLDFLSPKWGLKLLEAVWKVVRSQVLRPTKRNRVRRLIVNSFSRASTQSKEKPAHDAQERDDRLQMLAAFLDVLRLARELVTESGKEAVWFSRACTSLGVMAATVTPAAKAAVELFQAESRAHCGLTAVVPSVTLELCAAAAQEPERNESEIRSGASASKVEHAEDEKVSFVPAALRQSTVDIMHALYWRTKAGFDESSHSNTLEKLLHADVASGLYLMGSSISPVDGSPIDLSREAEILHIQSNSKTKTDDPNSFVDETRRVSPAELIRELQSLWASLPSSAGVVRAKVSWALAHHSKVEQRDFARAERFLFDGLRSLHSVREQQTLPDSFFSRVLHVSPVSLASSSLAGSLLRMYGSLTLSFSKYRYGIAALEAATDGRRVRNMDKGAYRSSVIDVVDEALQNSDWRRALVLLYNLRLLVQPKNGLRNEFVHLCVRLHSVCYDVGCFDASIVPLRAYSALIYEERLRVLLHRYRRRLAKKTRSKFRRYMLGTPLPKLLPGTTAFPNRTNPLASFFETPLVTAALDTTFRHSPSALDLRSRQATITSPTADSVQSRRSGTLRTFQSIFWPLRVPFFSNYTAKASVKEQKRSSSSRENASTSSSGESAHQSSGARPELKQESLRRPVNGARQESEFEEEQRELLRIEAEQEVSADSDRFRVELLRAQTCFAMADFEGADFRCRGLLEVCKVPSARYQVLEMMARIRLKRKEITKCLEFIDLMEREYSLMNVPEVGRGPTDNSRGSGESQKLSLFRHHDADKHSGIDDSLIPHPPEVTFLRLSALIHGGRLEEALYLADKALTVCDEHSFWNQGQLHFLRGKVLYQMSSTSAAPFQRKHGTYLDSENDAVSFNDKLIGITMTAFETASQFFDAAGDEIGSSTSDLLWARTFIDFLFRKVVLPAGSGGGLSVTKACAQLEKRIVLDEVLDTIYNVINIASSTNIPLLLIDSMAAMAEIKCIQGHPSQMWSMWVSAGWKLFSRLFTDAEDLTVVLSSIAPVSVLEDLRDICGRLVRLVMCDRQTVNVADMNTHLRIFEAYVTLQLSIDRKMNLASSVHRENSAFSGPGENRNDSEIEFSDATSSEANRTSRPTSMSTREISVKKSPGKHSYSRRSTDQKQNIHRGDGRSDRNSETEGQGQNRPAGAFLHMLGNEGVALGRQGFSLFINRPRQQVISAVKGTGAVLIPSNFFTNSKVAPGDGPFQIGRDAEMIFPFKPSLGLGAMQILHDNADGEEEMLPPVLSTFTRIYDEGNRNMQRPSDLSTRNYLSREPPSMRPSVKSQERSERGSVNNEDKKPNEILTGTNAAESKIFTTRKTSTAANPRRSNDEFEKEIDSGLSSLFGAVRQELDGGSIGTKGSAPFFGAETAHRVWAHLHRIKTETNRYVHGEITLEQLKVRNGDALSSWVQCIPPSRKAWTVPESIGRRLVYILYAHGVIGYYVVERGGSVERIAFGGKQNESKLSVNLSSERGSPAKTNNRLDEHLRTPTDAERLYLFDLVNGFKRDDVWHKDRDTEIVSGMETNVLKAPRFLLSSASPAQKSRSRPIVLIADLSLQILPWELFFDHVVIRSHNLLEVIRSLQEDPARSQTTLLGNEDPVVTANRRVVRFIAFGASRRELVDVERGEEARRQQLAFQGLLRLNHMSPSSLASFLHLGSFSDPTSMNAVVRPTGPLSSPLSQSRKAVKLLGMKVVAHIGRRNYPHVDFLRVAGLGSASMWDLKEAAMLEQPSANDKAEPSRDLGAYIPVFMFSYADLVDASESVFGLRRIVPNGILMFTPATHMKVLARHLEDDELTTELRRASGRMQNRIFPDVIASARVLVEYVSRFSREKRIPIVVFLGQGLVDVFPRKGGSKLSAAPFGMLR